MILERLYFAFAHIHAMIVQLNKHEFTIVFSEEFLDLLGALIVHHV